MPRQLDLFDAAQRASAVQPAPPPALRRRTNEPTKTALERRGLRRQVPRHVGLASPLFLSLGAGARRPRLEAAREHSAEERPAQGPAGTFVQHNTLHAREGTRTGR